MKAERKGASFEARGARGNPSIHWLCATSARQLAPRASRRAPRTGISLLEVLISMFVLLFGLMGVAAIFPVGNHYAARGEQYDRCAALTESAFGELKSRLVVTVDNSPAHNMLQPITWNYAPNPDGNVSLPETSPEVINPTPGEHTFRQPNGSPAAPGPGYVFVIDPMGAAAAFDTGQDNDPSNDLVDVDIFPYVNFSQPGFDLFNPIAGTQMPNDWKSSTTAPGLKGSRWPIRRITFGQAPGIPMSTAVAEKIFRLSDDLAVELPAKGDQPAIQRWRALDFDASSASANNTPDDPSDDMPLARDFVGNYSWLASVVPTSGDNDLVNTPDALQALQPGDPHHGSFSYEVSVAILYKRDPLPSVDSERAITAALNPGGELVVYATNNNVDLLDAALKGIRSGQWIALAGVHPATGQCLFKWYRLLSLDDESTEDDSLNGFDDDNLAVRRAMVEGPDWPAVDINGNGVIDPAEYPSDLRAILLPGVIQVTTQTMSIGPTGSPWQ